MIHAHPNPPAPLAVTQPSEILRGLDVAEGRRPAREFLEMLFWKSPTLDPESVKARDFLARL